MLSGPGDIYARPGPSVSSQRYIRNPLLLSQYTLIRAWVALHRTHWHYQTLLNQANVVIKPLFLSMFRWAFFFPQFLLERLALMCPHSQMPSADLWDMWACESSRERKGMQFFFSQPSSPSCEAHVLWSLSPPRHLVYAAVLYTTRDGLVAGIFITAQRIPTEPPTRFCLCIKIICKFKCKNTPS